MTAMHDVCECGGGMEKGNAYQTNNVEKRILGSLVFGYFALINNHATYVR